MPASRTYRLTAMTVADMLDNAVSLFKGNWRPIALVALLCSVPVGLVTLASELLLADQLSPGVDPSNFLGIFDVTNVFGGLIVAVLANQAVSIIFSSLAMAFVTRFVAGAFLNQSPRAKDVLRSVLRLWPALILVNFMIQLSLFAAVVSGFFLFLVGMVPTVLFVLVASAGAVPALVVEESGPFRAIGRSFRLCLSRGFLVYAGAMFFGTIVRFFFSFLITQLPEQLTSISFAYSDQVLTALRTVTSVVATAVESSVAALVALMIYFDARVRFEGFDVRLKMAKLAEESSRRA